MKKMSDGFARDAVQAGRARKAKTVRVVGIACFAALSFLLWTGTVGAEERVVRSLLEIRHENVVIQKWDLSCGAAALATLLRYQHGEEVSEKEIAIALMKRAEYIKDPQLIQRREGFSLLDLKTHVDGRGFLGNGFGKLQMKDIVAKAPLIVPITTNGYNHFVVFRGVQNGRVLLADPAWGNRTMRVEEFLDHWIEYPTLGRIGFAVQRRDGVEVPNRLSPAQKDFVMLR
jgi:hypothetical protein